MAESVVAGLLLLQVEGAKLVHRHELRLRMDAAIGRAPPISDMEMQVRDVFSAPHHCPRTMSLCMKGPLANLVPAQTIGKCSDKNKDHSYWKIFFPPACGCTAYHQGCEDEVMTCAVTFVAGLEAMDAALWQMELRREALHIAEEFREHNRTALLNLLSDSTTAVTGFLLLLRNSEGRGALFRTIGRIFSGFSDTAKAFLIIASVLSSSRPPCCLGS